MANTQARPAAWVVVPAYNEAEVVEKVVSGIYALAAPFSMSSWWMMGLWTGQASRPAPWEQSCFAT